VAVESVLCRLALEIGRIFSISSRVVVSITSPFGLGAGSSHVSLVGLSFGSSPGRFGTGFWVFGSGLDSFRSGIATSMSHETIGAARRFPHARSPNF
jgi:hypothetical protein